MAERKGPDFLRELCSAERFSEPAILSGSRLSKTFGSKVIASEFSVTSCDHLRFDWVFRFSCAAMVSSQTRSGRPPALLARKCRWAAFVPLSHRLRRLRRAGLVQPVKRVQRAHRQLQIGL